MTDGPEGSPDEGPLGVEPRRPLIVLCAPQHADVLERQFGH